MRYKGRVIEKPQPRVIPIVREPSEIPGNPPTVVDNNIYFVADVITDFTDFEKLCPVPVAPFVTRPNQPSYENVDDPSYKVALMAHSSKRNDWMILKSLEATPDLVWDTVKLGDSDTWSNYRQELRDAGFNPSEIQNLMNEVMLHNSIDTDKMEQARKSFLAGPARAGK